MADVNKACKSGEETKNGKGRAKTPVGVEKKKSSPSELTNDNPKSCPNGKSAAGSQEENQVFEMKNSDVNEREENAADQKSTSKSVSEFYKGLKVEVKDLPSDTWYVAKVVDIEGSDVLIHYVNWAARHDEWITMDSNRIRAVMAGSKVSTPPAPPPAAVTPVTSRKRGRPVGSGIKKSSTAGNSGANTSPVESAEVEPKEELTYSVGEDVKAIWTDSRKYPAKIVEVLENGTFKVAFSDGFEKVMGGSKISKIKPGEVVAAAPPPVMQELPVEDPDSKEGRRQRKRKINVAELFRRKPSTSKSQKESQPESPAPVPAKKIKIEEPDEKLLSPTTPDLPVVKRGRGRPPRKSLDMAASSPAAAPLVPKEEPIDLPEETNMEVESNEKVEEAPAMPESQPVVAAPPDKEPEKKIVAPAAPKTESTAVITKDAPALPLALEIPDEPQDIFVGSLKIEREGDNLKCPKEGCGKLLRKEKLIMMHIKHYHPELKQEMDVVPQVLDYAYARYIGDLPSTASMIRNFSNPQGAGSPSTHSAAPKKKPVKSPVKSAPEPVKSEDAATPAAITPSLTPRIQLGKSNNAKSSKTGLKVKTLLPVKKSLPPKNFEPKEKPEPKKSIEMPVLKKALMTPPMNSSTPNSHKSYEAIKEEKPLKSPIPVFPKKSPRKSPRKDHLVEDGAMELINCVCGYTEEDGLIIQCELCFCWQHGTCNLIDQEDDVPDKFVCHVCRDPAKERKSKKYSHDQDWLKKGTLPRLPILRLNEKYERSSLEKALKETQDIAAASLSLSEIIHALKIQINIAQKKDHPKLYLWSKEWKEREEDVVKVEPKEEPKEPKVEPPQMVPIPQSSPQKIDTLVLPEIGATFDPLPGTSACVPNPVDDPDLHPALKLPLSALEIEHLATTMAQSIPATDAAIEAHPPVMMNAPKAPEPEAAIKPGKCRIMLLKHIQHLQDQLEARICELESRNVALDRRAQQIYGKEVSDARVKETLRMLQRDVSSVHKIGNYAKKG